MFFAHNCIAAYWTSGYESDLNMITKRPQQLIRVYCRHHNRFEAEYTFTHLSFQLAAGFFTYDDRVFLVSRLFDKSQRDGALPGLQGLSSLGLVGLT